MSGSDPSDDRESFRPVDRKTSPGTKGGGAGGGASDECSFTEITNLSSPDRSVLATLAIGQSLDVVLETQPVPRVVAMTQSQQIAGSITSARLLDMMECMRRGYIYTATIREIVGGRVSVEINPA